MLAFARKQTIAPRVLDLNETVEGMLKMLRRLIGEDIDRAWLLACGVVAVPDLHPAQIDQILANLCVNALDAIAYVGKVTIETGMVTFDEAYCSEHATFIPGDFVLLAVSDDGCGMERQVLDKLLSLFSPPRRWGKARDWDWPLVYGIVMQNTGFINVYSEPGQGARASRFTSLAMWATRGQRVWPEIAPHIPSGQGETVLVVEDEAAILKLIETMLEKLGYTVLAAARPGEALQLAEAQSRSIDLLITDVIMPEMNGRDLAQRMVALYPDIKLLFMSGYTANVIAHHGVLDQGVQFVQKPVSRKDLAQKIRRILEIGD